MNAHGRLEIGMRWYSVALGSPEVAATPNQRPIKADMYDWALGRLGRGQPPESPHVHIETPTKDIDAYELARLIRGEGN